MPEYRFCVDSVTRQGAVARVRGVELLPSGTPLGKVDLILLPRLCKVRDPEEGRNLPWSDDRVAALTAAAFDWLLWRAWR